MPTYSEEFIDRVRQASDIAQIVARQVQLQRKGQNLWGLCPFHAEKTPSFSVNPAKQMYYCFGCHAHGSVFNFVMETEKLSFPEAVRALAERASIEVPEEATASPAARERQQERKLLYRVSQWVADFYHDQLLHHPEAEAARGYLRRRGLADELVQAMHLGFAPADWTGLVKAAERSQVPMDALAKLGLVLPRSDQSYYDRFRGRVIIPIADERGRVVAFGGRVLDESLPKYLNSPEHQLFSKGRLLFGLYCANSAIQKSGQAVLMEGYMDCLAAWQHGFPNVVASLGTALTPVQARLLARYTKQVVLCYDGDGPGLQAALRGLDILEQAALQVKVAVLPAGEDPDDCLRQRGREYFQEQVIGKARSALDFRLELLRRQYNLQDVAGKADYVAAGTAVLAKLDNEVLKTSYAEQMAHELQVSTAAVLAELAKHDRKLRPRDWNRNGNSRNTIEGPVRTVAHDVDPATQGSLVAESTLLGLLLNNVDGAEELLTEWQAEDVYAHPADRQLVAAMLHEVQASQQLNASKLLEQIADQATCQRLAEVAWSDGTPTENAETVARDCLQKLRQFGVRQAMARVQAELSVADSVETRRRLVQELQTLIEKQKVLRH